MWCTARVVLLCSDYLWCWKFIQLGQFRSCKGGFGGNLNKHLLNYAYWQQFNRSEMTQIMDPGNTLSPQVFQRALRWDHYCRILSTMLITVMTLQWLLLQNISRMLYLSGCRSYTRGGQSIGSAYQEADHEQLLATKWETTFKTSNQIPWWDGRYEGIFQAKLTTFLH